MSRIDAEAGLEIVVQQVEVFLGTGVTELQVERIESDGKVGNFIGTLQLVARLHDTAIGGRGKMRHLIGDLAFVHLTPESRHLQHQSVLFELRRHALRLVELLVRLIVEAFVEENAGEIQLLLQLEKGRMLHAQQAQADEYLTVQMRLHIGKLLLPDGGAPAEYPLLVVGFHSLQAVEQDDEFGFTGVTLPRGIQFEIAFLGLAHRAYEVENTLPPVVMFHRISHL